MKSQPKNSRFIWLSHPLNINTPAYGGAKSVLIKPDKQLAIGHSCNSLTLTLSNHIGTHVDAPYHFIEKGKKINDYQPEDWFFYTAAVVEMDLNDPLIISIQMLENAGIDKYKNADILLIKTGFERYRGEKKYWESSPGFSPELAIYLKHKLLNIRAVGFDLLSLTSYQHREIGREAHRAFLSNDIRIFEDLALSQLTSATNIKQIIALPLRLDDADGAPCTIVASIDHD